MTYITLVLYVIVAKCTEHVVLTRRYIFQVIQVPSTPPEILTVRDTAGVYADIPIITGYYEFMTSYLYVMPVSPWFIVLTRSH